jgi:hypothetical protein
MDPIPTKMDRRFIVSAEAQKGRDVDEEAYEKPGLGVMTLDSCDCTRTIDPLATDSRTSIRILIPKGYTPSNHDFTKSLTLDPLPLPVRPRNFLTMIFHIHALHVII